MTEVRRRFALVLFLFSLTFVLAQVTTATQTKHPTQPRVAAIEVFQVVGLPLSIQNAVLVRSDKGYVLKGFLSNGSDLDMVGLRYSLVDVDSSNVAHPIANRVEGLRLAPYATSSVTFQTPIRLKLKDGARLVLMLEQAIGTIDIWEVMKAKEALEAYIAADFSIIPQVMRVANQIDSPLLRQPRVIY